MLNTEQIFQRTKSNLYWIYHTWITLNPLIWCVSPSPFYFMKLDYTHTHTQAFALTDGWCRDNEMLYCAASGNCLSLVCENQGHSVSPCHCHTGSHLLSVCLSRLQPDTYSSHTLTYSTRLNHFFLILSYSRILLCATFGCHCWGFWKRDLLSISSSAQTHTGTEWHASLADSQVLKGRNLSLICLSSSVLLQWPNQTEREFAHTFQLQRETLQRFYHRKRLILIPAHTFLCFKEQFVIIWLLLFSYNNFNDFFLLLLIKICCMVYYMLKHVI